MASAQLRNWIGRLGLKLSQERSEVHHFQSHQKLLEDLSQAQNLLLENPYCLPLYVFSAQCYHWLGFPDLAAGEAYKALLLSDAIQDESDEYHEHAVDALTSVITFLPADEKRHVSIAGLNDSHDRDVIVSNARQWLTSLYLPLIYRILIRSLLTCGCYRTAFFYCSRARQLFSLDADLQQIQSEVHNEVADRLNVTLQSVETGEHSNSTTWPDSGYVRREYYPWNHHEPNRLEELSVINTMMNQVAPKLEVLAVELPMLTDTISDNRSVTTRQLGVFAKEDVTPGEVVLDETSMLTANNKLQDALCDACSADLPQLDSPEANTTTSCPDCESVFCSERCYDLALELYHPALCGMDVEAIAKDVPPAQAADSLYSLLLLRTFAMAETQQCHPLELKEVKYIWGDFHDMSLEKHWRASNGGQPDFCGLPKTIPFNFEHNIRLPFHMLEKMDIDIFANPQYDVWVSNTLYAKFRGTASARLSGLGGRAIRGPEVSAVHSMWCMANHSCDPNVSWEWGGSINFWAREKRIAWEKDGEETYRSAPGIKKGEEIFNHYCDIDLPVKERREWARGSLGGDCRCARCTWEAKVVQQHG
ncbi:hypothetical protein LTR37_019370 [Vermiconidia calcicola]|uniref:Uncharacterized protein n=1 Tax=Vermiconidia calcicola TaxID=1690605 RepID=A0ACC3MFH4_9PEZI|nr:hypothetical protein LTR37_019370 [Vermiconidia calcicola]